MHESVPNSNSRASQESISGLPSVERELNAILQGIPKRPDDKRTNEARAVRRFFSERFPSPSTRERLSEMVLATDDRGFSHLALCQLIDLLARNGERTVLVRLLSKRCPDRVHVHTSIESLLAIIYARELPDGTLVLCDAFDQSTDDSVRSAIAGALRRGYKAAGIAKHEDAEFVAACRKWYIDNAAFYEPNLNYLHHLLRGTDFPYEREGVLKRK